jgi:hypothetical protein
MSQMLDWSSPPAMPRWVKAFAWVAGVLLVLLLLLIVLSPGRHGPGRHIHGGSPATMQPRPASG